MSYIPQVESTRLAKKIVHSVFQLWVLATFTTNCVLSESIPVIPRCWVSNLFSSVLRMAKSIKSSTPFFMGAVWVAIFGVFKWLFISWAILGGLGFRVLGIENLEFGIFWRSKPCHPMNPMNLMLFRRGVKLDMSSPDRWWSLRWSRELMWWHQGKKICPVDCLPGFIQKLVRLDLAVFFKSHLWCAETTTEIPQCCW